MNKRKPLTMKRIFEFVENYCVVNCVVSVRSSAVYRAMNAYRDRETWRWLLGEIYHNGVPGPNQDKLAPVTLRGEGRRGLRQRFGRKNRGGESDPYMLMLSEEWDSNRDWDAEHAAF